MKNYLTIVEFPAEPTVKDWRVFGLRLKAAERYVQWYLGYWWNYGHRKWSREAEEFIQELGYSRQTLKVYGSVCKSVKPLTRVNDLTFKHHQLIAPLSESKQRKYLKSAKENNWSTSVLREAIKKENNHTPGEKDLFRICLQSLGGW